MDLPGVIRSISHPQIFIIDPQDQEQKDYQPIKPDLDEYIEQEVNIVDSIEEVKCNPLREPIEVDISVAISQDNQGTIRAMFDTGASINCIDQTYALRHYKGQIQKTRGFYCSTGGGRIVIEHYISYKVINLNDGTTINTKWYLLKGSPHRFICSRQLFFRLGGRIELPNGQRIFTNTAVQEKLSPDLYDQFYKHMEYPTSTSEGDKQRVAEFVNFIEEKQQEHRVKYTHNNQYTVPDTAIIDIPTHKGKLSISCPDNIISIGIRTKFEDIIKSNTGRYALDFNDIGTIPNTEFKIELKPDAEPVQKNPYPLSFKLSDEVERQSQELYKAGIIEPSESEFASPVIMVPKPTRNGTEEWRMCIDLRALNDITIKDKYRIPTMRDLYRKLSGKKIFSAFDLRSGYYHIPIRPQDKHKTAFITDQGKMR